MQNAMKSKKAEEVYSDSIGARYVKSIEFLTVDLALIECVDIPVTSPP